MALRVFRPGAERTGPPPSSARKGAKPVSTASVYHLGAGYGMIGSVATLPAYQGKGYASQAVLAARRLGDVPGRHPSAAACWGGTSPLLHPPGFFPLGEAGQFFFAPTK